MLVNALPGHRRPRLARRAARLRSSIPTSSARCCSTRCACTRRCAAVAIALLLFAVLHAARATGKAIRAAADNHLGALVVGLDVRRLYAFTFGVGAACVGAAGALMITIIR